MNGRKNGWIAITVAAISAATAWLEGAMPARAQTLPEVVQAIEKARVPLASFMLRRIRTMKRPACWHIFREDCMRTSRF